MKTEISWEEAVRRLRTMPDQATLIEDAYLDADNLAAAERFVAGEEFAEVLSILKYCLRKAAPWDILDIGAGNGIATYAFAEAGHNVFAVEPDPSTDVGAGAIERLAKATGTNIKVIADSAESISLSDECIDVVYVRQALHHAGDLDKMVKQAYRVLRSDGVLLATREHVVDDEEQLDKFLDAHALHKWYGGENAYRLGKYLDAFKNAGFTAEMILGPYDSVINYFPESKAEFRARGVRLMERVFGKSLTRLISSGTWWQGWYSRFMTIWDRKPGRLYSFLARKTA